jgi:hypothetical protein
MYKVTRFIALFASFVLTFGVAGSLAAATSRSKDSSKTVSKMSVKPSPAAHSTTEHMKTSSIRGMNHVLASAEELSGTIAFIGPSDKEVTLVGANGIPYDFQLTRKTKVELAGKKIGATEFTGENHKEATIRFLPTSRGNMAESVNISAS